MNFVLFINVWKWNLNIVNLINTLKYFIDDNDDTTLFWHELVFMTILLLLSSIVIFNVTKSIVVDK